MLCEIAGERFYAAYSGRMAANRASDRSAGKSFTIAKHESLPPLLVGQKIYDELFLPVLANHRSAISIGQMAEEARSEGAPSNAVLSARIWAASAKRRGLVSTPDSAPNSICLNRKR